MNKTDQNILNPNDRVILPTSEASFHPYDRYGFENPAMDWVPLSADARGGFETFVLKMKPGAQSTPHRHHGREEFLVLNGSMIDCDGTEFKTGDYVKYRPGSTHYSHSVDGCTLLVILTGQNEQLDEQSGEPTR